MAHADFASAYKAGLTAVLERGEPVDGVRDELSVGSAFGDSARPTLELRPWAFRVANPRHCLLRSTVRQPNLAFALGQWLWMMRGSDSVEEISFYNPKGRLFSDDGETLRGAFGYRIRTRWGDQLQSAIDLIRRDPTTRRALVNIGSVGDVTERTRDQPCAISLHALLRNDRLEATTTMRSQSALMVLPYDAALFMAIHVWMAALLGVEPGPHTLIAQSFHVYDDEVELARRVLAAPADSESLPPIVDPEGTLVELLEFEYRLRRAVDASDEVEIHALVRSVRRDGDFGAAVEYVLLAHAAGRLGDEALFERALSNLPRGWRNYFAGGIPASRPSARARRIVS